MIISIEYFYWLAGVLLLITAGMILTDRTHPKRWTSGLFWALFALVFLIGDRLSPFVVGIGVLVMAGIAGIGGVGRGTHAELHVKAARASAGRLGHKLFIPALSIPLVTVIGSILLKNTQIGGVPLLDPKNTTFVSLGIGCMVALVLVGMYDANPAVMAAIGMFSGYCGTLMTPMAANFNIVPVALLELPDKYAVIKAQMPTALMMLVVNIVLLYTLM